MSIHAAKNIALAVDTFQERGYATLGGVIVNKRNVRHEEENIRQLCEDIQSDVVGTLERSELVQDADELRKTVIEAFPDSPEAESYRELADAVLKAADRQNALRGE
jgi:nitrogenase iron protein NifH